MMSIHIYNDYDDLALGLAEWIVKDIDFVLKQQERYSFVLSGGSTPKKLYDILVVRFSGQVDWQRVDFFWGDERYVPFDDGRNNGKMAYEALLQPLNIKESQIYRMQTSPTPEEASSAYENVLKEYFGDEPHEFTFDFSLLGMGDDGHTLSVFPHSVLLNNRTDWVQSVFNPNDGLQRVTLLPWLVNRSRKIAFMAKGKGKTETLHQVLYGAYNPEIYPSQLIKNEAGGGLMWFVDADAFNG